MVNSLRDQWRMWSKQNCRYLNITFDIESSFHDMSIASEWTVIKAFSSCHSTEMLNNNVSSIYPNVGANEHCDRLKFRRTRCCPRKFISALSFVDEDPSEDPTTAL